MAKYNRSWMNGPFLQLEEDVDGYLALEQEKEALEVWSVSNAKKYQLSLDTFETEYLPTLKAMGVEKVISIYQKALDNYNAR